MDKAPEGLKGYYAGLAQMREMSENMKKNQSLRGVEKLKERMAYRATNHKTWRQMKGMQWWMHEMNHPGNQAFVIGFA